MKVIVCIWFEDIPRQRSKSIRMQIKSLSCNSREVIQYSLCYKEDDTELTLRQINKTPTRRVGCWLQEPISLFALNSHMPRVTQCHFAPSHTIRWISQRSPVNTEISVSTAAVWISAPNNQKLTDAGWKRTWLWMHAPAVVSVVSMTMKILGHFNKIAMHRPTSMHPGKPRQTEG